MKLLIWAVTALLALMWTVGAWAVAALLGWVASSAAPADAAEWGRVLTEWPMPAWLTLWIDPATIHAALGGLAWTLEKLQSAWPGLQGVIGALVPLTWIVWGIGLAGLLALAGLVHWLVARVRAPAAPALRAT